MLVMVLMVVVVLSPPSLADQARLNYATTFLHVFKSFKTFISEEKSLLESEKEFLLNHLPQNKSILRVQLCSPDFQRCEGSTQLKGLRSTNKTFGYVDNATCVRYAISYVQESECSCMDESMHSTSTLLYEKLLNDEGLSWKISKSQMNVSCHVTEFTPSEDPRQSRHYHHTLKIPLDTTSNTHLDLNVCTSNLTLCEGGVVHHMMINYDKINVRLDDDKTVELTVPSHKCSCTSYPNQHKHLNNTLHELRINVTACGVFITAATPFNITYILQNEAILALQKCEATARGTNSTMIEMTDKVKYIENIDDLFFQASRAPIYFHTLYKGLLILLVILHYKIYICFT
ncbi:hypothetical protein OTU49_006022 [Cherax quadricarinatus]|uniref:Phlebovirus glycoprotein G2 fusion domain-containing protein n=1 Tax=Cherax quadricarinatus TaxID=27406 RepID=A0AAW0WPJ5_CHEQU